MRLTILGKSPAWSDAGGACSGYLVTEGDTALVVDCGNGAFGKLRLHTDYAAVEEVAITHLHGDHVLDLVPFAYGLTLPPREPRTRPVLRAPAGAEDFFIRLCGTWDDADLIPKAFEIEEYGAGDAWRVGPLELTAHAVRHVGATHAFEVRSPSGARVVIGSDGRYSDELIEAARGADVLLAEATLPDPDPGQSVHMSAEEAGRLAREAGVGRLVLIHVSDELDLDRQREAAAREFGGEVDVAADGAAYEL